jgi:hypothetical protein
MSESAEAKLIEMFDKRLEEIYGSYRNLRKWTYALLTVFALSLLSAMYWAGNLSANVNKMTEQTNRIEAKVDDVVLYMAREFKYNPVTRGSSLNGKE